MTMDGRGVKLFAIQEEIYRLKHVFQSKGKNI
jgi:hypothetical protein